MMKMNKSELVSKEMRKQHAKDIHGNEPHKGNTVTEEKLFD